MAATSEPSRDKRHSATMVWKSPNWAVAFPSSMRASITLLLLTEGRGTTPGAAGGLGFHSVLALTAYPVSGYNSRNAPGFSARLTVTGGPWLLSRIDSLPGEE